MSGPDPRWERVDAYFEDLLVPSDPVLEDALAEAERAGLPPISVSPLQGRLLELLGRALGARRILEVGTLAGYSAICLARALPADGRLVTLELEERHAAVARANLDRAGLGDRVEVRVGRADATLKALVAERAGPFDLVFIDADKVSYDAYYEAVLPKLAPHGLIVVDNTLQGGRVLASEERPNEAAQALRAFNDKVVNDRRVACVLTTIRDGVTLIRHAAAG